MTLALIPAGILIAIGATLASIEIRSRRFPISGGYFVAMGACLAGAALT